MKGVVAALYVLALITAIFVMTTTALHVNHIPSHPKLSVNTTSKGINNYTTESSHNPTSKTINRPTSKSSHNRTTKQINHPSNESSHNPTTKSINRPSTESSHNPTTKSINRPTTKHSYNRTTKSINRPTTKRSHSRTTKTINHPTTRSSRSPNNKISPNSTGKTLHNSTTKSYHQATTSIVHHTTSKPPGHSATSAGHHSTTNKEGHPTPNSTNSKYTTISNNLLPITTTHGTTPKPLVPSKFAPWPVCKDTAVTDQWKQGALWCFCNDGEAWCSDTRPPVRYRPWRKDCIGSPVWYKACNICKCHGGRSICSMRHCQKRAPKNCLARTWYHWWAIPGYLCRCVNGSIVCEKIARLRFGRWRCWGHVTWRSGCNWCTCVYGRSYCTKRCTPYVHHQAPVTDMGKTVSRGTHTLEHTIKHRI